MPKKSKNINTYVHYLIRLFPKPLILLVITTSFLNFHIFNVQAQSCTTSTECDDNNPCTFDRCGRNPECGPCPIDGPCPPCPFVCIHDALDGPCDDGIACTTGDVCSGGLCNGTPNNSLCSDGDVCTDDVCTAGVGCSFPNNTASCDDGDACTTGDVCSDGSCVSGSALDCDDSNECTDDSCDPSNGCMHVNNSAPCGPGDACTAHLCIDGQCTETGIFCDDDNVCTDDSCDPSRGCIFVDNTIPCDDGDYCSVNDQCTNGKCVGAARDVDDGVECTDDSCDETNDVIVNTLNDANCDDGLFCNGAETCDAVADCQPGDPVENNTPCGDDSSGICIDTVCVLEGDITIIKEADPMDGTDFEFICLDESGAECEEIESFSLDDADPDDGDEIVDETTFTGVLAGPYMIQEMLPEGWRIIDICCDDPDGETTVDLNVPEAMIDLDPGEEVTCTFRNEFLCGNGTLDEGEECDDGNRVDGDGCSSACIHEDNDGDGVLDKDDVCLGTPAGEVVDPDDGCSIHQLCPCENGWKNHGDFVSCVSHISDEFVADGLITEAEKDAIVSAAAQSDCGSKK